MLNSLQIPGYPELKLLKCGPEGDTYISNNPNAIVKIFYFSEDKYEYDEIQKTCRLSIHFSKLLPQYVPQIYLNYETKEYVALIMENIESITLNDYIINKNNYNVENVFNIVKSLIEAIFALNNLGYVHDDLHGGNILITNNYDVKLIDFSCCDNVDSICGDGEEPKLYSEQLCLKYYIARLIFPNLPLSSIYDTMNIIKTYTVKDIIEYNTKPLKAEQLYNIFSLFDNIKCYS